MSPQRRLRKSGQKNRKTREVWPQGPVEKCLQEAVLRAVKCSSETSCEPNSSEACEAPANLTTLLGYHSLCWLLCQAVFFFFKWATSVPTLGLLCSSLLLTRFSAFLTVAPSHLSSEATSSARPSLPPASRSPPSGSSLSHLPAGFFRAFVMIQVTLFICLFICLLSRWPTE